MQYEATIVAEKKLMIKTESDEKAMDVAEDLTPQSWDIQYLIVEPVEDEELPG